MKKNLMGKYPALVSQCYINDKNQQTMVKKIKATVKVSDSTPVVQLEGSVSEAHRLVITYPTNMIETRKEIKRENEYRINHEGGFIYVHPKLCGTTMQVEYYTTGGTFLSFERIFTELDLDGNVVKRLSDILEEGKLQLEIVEKYADLVTCLKELKQNVAEAKRVLDIINNTNGNTIEITKEDWLGTTGNYYYVWKHNANTYDYGIDFTEKDANGVWRNADLSCVKNDENTLTIYAYEKEEVRVHINAQGTAVLSKIAISEVINDTLNNVAKNYSGVTFDIGIDDWVYDTIKKTYKKAIRHNQNTYDFMVSFTEVVDGTLKGAMLGYDKYDPNIIVVYSLEPMEIQMYITSKSVTVVNGDFGNFAENKYVEELVEDTKRDIIDNYSGLERNRGALYPLKLVKQDGATTDFVMEFIKDSILDIKVINANPNKYYKIDWIGNGYSEFGKNAEYGFRIWDYDKNDYSTNSQKSARRIVDYVDTINKNLFNINDKHGVVQEDNFVRFNLKLKPNTKYTCSSNAKDFKNTASIYFNGGSSTTNGISASKSYTITTGNTGETYVLVRKRDVPSNEGYDVYSEALRGNCWIQIEEGDKATAYEPYYAPKDISTRFINSKYDNVRFVITIDYSKINKEFIGTTLFGTAIIDPNCYITTTEIEGIATEQYVRNNVEVAKNDIIHNYRGQYANRGIIYPLRLTTQDGKLTQDLMAHIKEAILDIKVINANPNKLYKLEWVGNGYTGFGEKSKYGFIITDFDKSTYDTDSKSSRRILANHSDVAYDTPSGITTRIIKCREDNVKVSITINYSKIIDKFIGSTLFGTAIIDQSCYIPASEGSGGADKIDKDYPLFHKDTTQPELHTHIKKAIKDIKVFNANPNKIYKIEYIANGTTAWGKPSYCIYMNEYDNDFTNGKIIFQRGNNEFPAPTKDIETRLCYHEATGIGLSITLDYSELLLERYPMNSPNGAGKGHIIHPSCYMLRNDSVVVPEVEVPINYDLALYYKGTQDINVKFPYDNTRNCVVNFGQLGVNKITHIKHISFTQNTEMNLSFNELTHAWEISSDWLSPYGCKETQPKHDYLNAFTVGGNHGTNNGAGFPTANSISTEVFVDGVKAKVGQILGAKNCIEILTKNYISASNVINKETGVRDSNTLLETVLYKVYKDNIYINVEIEALRPCKITRYCGWQLTAPPLSMQDKLYYMLENIYHDYNVVNYKGKAIYSCQKQKGKLDRFNYYGAKDMIVCYKDTNVGIGDGRYINNDDCPIYKSTSTKVYMHNIRQEEGELNINLDTKDSLYWAGGYVIKGIGLKCEGCKRAYTIREEDERVYCIDFDKSCPKTYLETYVEDRGKKIIIIDKSDNVTCENFITSNGLRVSSNGYGQLKFKVK